MEGDAWIARWVDPSQHTHQLYEPDVELLKLVAGGRVFTDSRFPRSVYTMRGGRRQRVGPRARLDRWVTAGAVVASPPELMDGSAGRGQHEETTYQLAVAMRPILAVVT